jgi:hypothetical protein
VPAQPQTCKCISPQLCSQVSLRGGQISLIFLICTPICIGYTHFNAFIVFGRITGKILLLFHLFIVCRQLLIFGIISFLGVCDVSSTPPPDGNLEKFSSQSESEFNCGNLCIFQFVCVLVGLHTIDTSNFL